MSDQEKLPRRSYDLIKWLDQIVQVPPWPTSAQGCAGLDEKSARALIFLAGQRHMVDTLIGLMNEETRGDDESSSDGPPSRFVRFLSKGSDVHSLPVSEFIDLDS